MLKRFRFLGYFVLLGVAFVLGYAIGSLRGSEFANFYRQSNQMYAHYLTTKMIQDGKSEEAYRHARHLTSIYHRNVADSPLLKGTCILPAVDYGDGSLYVFRSVNDATRRQIAQVGQFLIQSDATNLSTQLPVVRP